MEEVGLNRPQVHLGEEARGLCTQLWSEGGEDRFCALFFDRVEHGVGDVGERFIPGNALELPGAALADAF
jgi:hypothetical protein